MNLLLGQLAALGAAICWTICTPCFTLAGRRIGSVSVNVHRLVIAAVILSAMGYFMRGHMLPTDAPPEGAWWLIASGLVGFFICDLCLFQAYLMIGPRLTLLIVATAPVIAAICDWLFRGDLLGPIAILGMTVTLSGVAWVISEGREKDKDKATAAAPDAPLPDNSNEHHHRRIGLLLAVFAAIFQAVGMIFADIGVGDFDPFAATQLRLFAGLLGFFIMITVTGKWTRVLSGIKDRKAMGLVAFGALTGPVLTVGLGILSLQYIPTGMTMTIMALPPVFILPISYFLLKEPVSMRAILGAVIAVMGVSILFAAPVIRLVVFVLRFTVFN